MLKQYTRRKDKMLLSIITVTITITIIISNGNRTEWSPIRSVIIQTELDDTKSYYQLIIKITISEKKKTSQVIKRGKICIKILTKKAYTGNNNNNNKNNRARAHAHVMTTLNVIG